MALHPLAEHFASVADAYERGRPGYPPAAVGAITAELGVAPSDPVLDLAAGTGKLSRVLLDAGLDVVAVEPLESLREVLAGRIGAARVRAGVAEHIPLPDASVALVTVSDAFHWFDHQVALSEIRRVLRPGGGLAVLATVPDWSDASWSHELGTLLQELRPPHPHFDGPPWQEAVRASDEWTALREVRVTTLSPAEPDRIVDYVSSMSWVAAMPEGQRIETLERIRVLIQTGDTPPGLPVQVIIGLTSRT
jgi:SAM-dependent methyltransferase